MPDRNSSDSVEAAKPLNTTWTQRLVIAGFTLISTLGFAVAANLAFDFSMFTVKPLEQWTGPLHTGGRWPNILVVWLAVVAILAIVGRLWLTLGIATVLAGAITMINYQKLTLRNDPLRLSDSVFLSDPAFLTDMVGIGPVIMAVIGILALLAIAWLLGHLAHKRWPRIGAHAEPKHKWLLRGLRLGVAVLCLALLAEAGNFNEPGNQWRALYESTGLRWRKFDQRANFLRNGFVAGLLYNTHTVAMPTPPGYSKASMDALVAKYSAIADKMNKGRRGSLDKVNVITILSESFSHPNWLQSVHWDQDLTPYTDKLMTQTDSGKMLSPGFGGGTANVEFEVLTGQSLGQFNPQVEAAYEQVVANQSHYPSLVDWMLATGHETVALHPFQFRMYRRRDVFQAFGIHELIDKTGMHKPYRVDGGSFISDSSAFTEAIRQIDQRDKPLFLHLITMQNHMPYDDQYDDPIPPARFVPEKADVAAQYARGLTISDAAMEEFLAKLKKSKEPTVVVFYGDHLPGELYHAPLIAREGIRRSHETPWFVWSNRADLAKTVKTTVSPTQLFPALFNATDTPLPPWFAFLNTLRDQVPATDLGIMIGPDNQVMHEKALNPEQRQILRDYRMFQYDLSIGKRYSEKAMFANPSQS